MGKTGLSVSRLCLGTMTFGNETDETGSHAQLDAFAAAGLAEVNLLADAANHDRLSGVLATRGTDPWGTPITVSRKDT